MDAFFRDECDVWSAPFARLHETGDGVINLILLAKNAAKVWEKIEPIVEDASDELDINAVAFRNLDAEEFTVLWPVDYEGEFELA